EEAAWVDDGEAVVGLGREVDDRVDLLVAQDALCELAVADVAFDEGEPLLDVLEAGAVSGVREQVEDDDVVVRVALDPEADEVGADEPGSAGDEDSHRRNLSGRAFGLCLVDGRRVLWTNRHTFVAIAMTVCGSSSGQSTAGTANAASREAATTTSREGARGSRAGPRASAGAAASPTSRCAAPSTRGGAPGGRAPPSRSGRRDTRASPPRRSP